MALHGIRGATTVEKDDQEEVLSATEELVLEILKKNPAMKPQDIGSAFFTVTEDIVSAYPALAARRMGWESVPMLCAREIPVVESLPLCIRVMIHWNTDLTQEQISHVYLRKAISLRPDLAR